MTSLRPRWQGTLNLFSIHPVLCIFLQGSEQHREIFRKRGKRGVGDRGEGTEITENKMNKK